MKVYVVQTHYDYEGSQLNGVYSTQAKAEKRIEHLYKMRGGGSVHYDCEEWEVR